MSCMNLNESVTINNAAKEPEIIDLCNFIQKLGVSIKGIGTSTLIVTGRKNIKKNNYSYKIIPDRIEAGTFMIATSLCGGNVKLNNICSMHLENVIQRLIESGSIIDYMDNSLRISSNKKIKPVNVKTDVYPGFPTDLQAQWIALMSKANGSSLITDTIYTDRFTHIPELIRLGANISMKNNVANVIGIKKFYGTDVMSTDIRASASLIIAGMSAYGTTNLSRIYHIDRGYEKIENKLNELGGNITRINVTY